MLLYYNNNLYTYKIKDIEYQDKTGKLYLKNNYKDVLTLINDIHVELDIFNDFEYDFKNYIGKEYKDYFTKLYNNNRDEFFDNLFNVIDVGVFWGETDNGTETYDMIQSAFAKKLNMMWRLTQN